MLKIGALQLKSALILAPLAGISDLPFRMLNREFGCELAFVEMINVRSLGFKSVRTAQMLSTCPEDTPLGVQLLAKEPAYLERALDILKKYRFHILDFNAACPERKVTRRGEGASLLKEPRLLQALLRIVVKNASVPVTVKIRTGWDAHSVNGVEVARAAQDAGIAALFIHGRTRQQGYSGSVDYKTIENVKKALDIPVIASGDVLSAPLSKKMFDRTGCDGVLVARGALGNPWIFRECEAFLEDGACVKRPSRDEVSLVMRRHLESCIGFHGERVGVVLFRKFFGWYTKGLRGVRPLREKVSAARSRQDMVSIFEAFLEAG